ncbi:MAG: DHH family phosphoesterase [Micromonosporaceae bacterium]
MSAGAASATTPTLAVTDALDRAAELLAGRPRAVPILLACHVNPDGDALGSMLGFGLGLRRLGFTTVAASFPVEAAGGAFEVPAPFRFLPGLDLLVPPDTVGVPDIGISFDAASPARLGPLTAHLAAASAWLVLDHHASNPGFGTLDLVDPGAAATAVVAAQLLDRLGVEYDRAIATCLYVGLATDTGSFRFDSTTPQVHALAARLLAAGAPAAEIALRLFDSRPYGAVRLLADVLARSEFDPAAAHGRGLVLAYALPEDLDRYGQPAHVLESFVDILRTTAEADVSCLVKPAGPGQWSISLRSRGGTAGGAVAVALGGGGHRLAAGFTGYGDVAAVLAAIRAGVASAPIPPG